MAKQDMRLLLATVLALSCVAPSAPASNAADTMLTQVPGVSILLENDHGRKFIDVSVNKGEFLDAFQVWKDERILRQDTTETEFRSHPYSYSGLFALYSVIPFLHGPHSRFNGSPLGIVGNIVQADDYGHRVSHRMFSFTFDEDMNAKIDWGSFDATAFQRIAPDFHYTPWFQDQLRSEPP
jgi:hypothetical protein